tara:strand:+ start:668 stop:1606 length:939 start_codon:yes stop_codon:yes gene_type:complete
MLILIDGFWGSGKSMIKILLNGHPDLLVSPVQESIVSSFHNNKNLFKYLKYKDIRIIRKILADSFYYDLQRLKYKRFDFNKFDNDLFKSIEKLKSWNIKILIELIYKKISFHLYKKNKQKIVFLENNSPKCYAFFIKNFPKSKIIYVKRDIDGIISSLIKRKINKKDSFTDDYKNFNFNYLVNKLRIPTEIIFNDRVVKTLKSKYPKNIYICEFDNLIFNNKKEMKKISKFLNISFNKQILKAEAFKSNINKSEIGIGKIIHDPKKILSVSQSNFLKCFEKKSFIKYMNINYSIYQVRYFFFRIIKNFFYNT